MKKINLYLYLFIMIFPISLIAETSKKDCGSDGYHCLPNCMQIYISNPALPGTEAECKKNWDYFVAKKNWCMLTIMAFNGYGQKADPKLAREYAQKADNGEDEGSDNCTVGALVSEVDSRINGSTDNKAETLNVCNLASGANSHGLCGSYTNDDLKNKVNSDLRNFAAQLTAKQAAAAQAVWDRYAAFVASDNAFRDSIGQFQGSGVADWSENSITIMLKFYIYAFNNFIHAYPDKFKTITGASELDQQLNTTYKEIQQQFAKIPEDYMHKKDINAQLISAEKSWLSYRNAFVQLGKLYYGNKYQADEIQQTLTGYLTRRRLAELKDQLETIKENLSYNWYKDPF